MTRRFIGVRWWLGAGFAVVAATSTAIVVAQFSSRSENALRKNAVSLVAGSAYLAAATPHIERHLPAISERRDLDLYLYTSNGALLGKAAARTHYAAAGAERARVLRAALQGRREALSTSSGGIVVVGVPLGSRALVAVSRRPDVAAAVGILNDQALRAGVIAGVIGVLVGLLLAQLIALRLRRLSSAAEAIATGDFERSVGYRFRDEFGVLAHNFDRMRRQLRRSFRQIEGERDRLRILLERLHEGVVTVDDRLLVQLADAAARWALGGGAAGGRRARWAGGSRRATSCRSRGRRSHCASSPRASSSRRRPWRRRTCAPTRS